LISLGPDRPEGIHQGLEGISSHNRSHLGGCGRSLP
jgi:hypothetical protein